MHFLLEKCPFQCTNPQPHEVLPDQPCAFPLMLLIISSLCLLFFVKFGIMDWEFFPWGVKQRRTKTGNGFSRRGGEGCNWWEDRSARYKATCRAGLSACFQAMFANPSGSASDVLFANIYVNWFCLLRYFGSGCLLLFIHELWWVCVRACACVPHQIFAFHYSLFAVHMLLLVICCPLFSFKSSTLCPQELKTILGARCCTLYKAAANKGIY